MDVTEPFSTEKTVASITDVYGVPKVWVSNAGVSHMDRFLDVTTQQLDRTIGVNLRGVFLAGQCAGRVMASGGLGGCIVNVASAAGKQGGVPSLSDYIASKFALVGLARAMVFELAEFRIRVNSVCPGYGTTPMQERELGWEAGFRGLTVENVRGMYLADTPLRRLEQPEDVARVVAFLVSEDAGFITDEAVAVNGGAFID